MILKPKTLKFLKQYGWLILLSSILLYSLLMMSRILQNSSQFAAYYSSLLALSFVGLAVLIGLFAKTIFKLKRQYDARVPGIKLTLRLTYLLSIMVALPMAIIYYFALNFIHQGIDQWFDVKTETALSDAVSLVQITQDNNVRKTLNTFQELTQQMASQISADPITAIDKIRRQLQAQEASIYSKNGQLIAYSSQFSTNILPNQPDSLLFQQLRNHRAYAAIETVAGIENAHQFIRLFIPVTDHSLQVENFIQAIIPIPGNQTQLANQVKVAAGQYNELSYLRSPLKTSITLILSLTLLLTLITAILFIVQTIKNFARPIKTLAQGTQAVMKGDYSQTMPKDSEDDFGQLIDYFNELTQQIAKA
jgi:nitrogen fixation/metabolism regulation signal transduction histidine kinase